MNDEGDCGTAPATPGLLKRVQANVKDNLKCDALISIFGFVDQPWKMVFLVE